MKNPNSTAGPTTRPPAVAGTFYPADRPALQRMVAGFVKAGTCLPDVDPKAIIAPHAGYVFSGPVAGSAFAHWTHQRDLIKRIILLGPSHFTFLDGLALSGHDAFATPLGAVPVDPSASDRLRSLPQVQVRDEPHTREHSLEVELPFLQHVLGEFEIVPLVIGEATDQEISAVIDALWGGPETRIVVSSDLSHVRHYQTAKEMDAAAARAIETLDPAALDPAQACGCRPVRGLLCSAKRRGLRAQTADLRNSTDTAGAHERVVGYGAFVFSQPATNRD
jgi:AmmeMemoRadiSam system protein B